MTELSQFARDQRNGKLCLPHAAGTLCACLFAAVLLLAIGCASGSTMSGGTAAVESPTIADRAPSNAERFAKLDFERGELERASFDDLFAGLSLQIDAGWIWDELTRRATQDMLSAEQIERIVALLEQTFIAADPGHEPTLSECRPLLIRLQRGNQLTDEQIVRIANSYAGPARAHETYRWQQGDRDLKRVALAMRGASLILLGTKRRMTLTHVFVADRKVPIAVELQSDSGFQYEFYVHMPDLPPGRHTMVVPLEQAIFTDDNVFTPAPKLRQDADGHTKLAGWTDIVEIEFEVIAPDALPAPVASNDAPR